MVSDSNETASSRQNRPDSRVNSESVTAHKRPPKFKSNKISALERGSIHRAPTLAKKLFAIDTCWEKGKKISFLQCSITGYINTCQVRPQTQGQLPNTKWTLCVCDLHTCLSLFGLIVSISVCLFLFLLFVVFPVAVGVGRQRASGMSQENMIKICCLEKLKKIKIFFCL